MMFFLCLWLFGPGAFEAVALAATSTPPTLQAAQPAELSPDSATSDHAGGAVGRAALQAYKDQPRDFYHLLCKCSQM